MLELLANQGFSMSGKMAESGVNAMLSDRMDARHQGREATLNSRSMAHAQQLNIKNLQQAPSAYVQGLKAAGVNPALALSGQIPVGQSPSALGTAGGASFSPGTDSLASASAALQAKKQSELTDSEIELNRSTSAKNYAEAGLPPAEIAKKEAETEYQQRLNCRLADADAAAAEHMSVRYSELAKSADSQLMRDYYSSMAERAKGMTLGALQAQMQFTDWLRGLSDYDRDVVLNLVHKKVGQLQLGNNADLRALADMPLEQFKQVVAHTGDLNASRQLRDAERKQITELLEDRKSLLQAQTEQASASASYHSSAAEINDLRLQQMPKELEMEKHKNFVQMMDDGEYGNAALYLLEDIVGMVVGFLAGRYARGSRPPTMRSIQQTLDEVYKTEEYTTPSGKRVTKTTHTRK